MGANDRSWSEFKLFVNGCVSNVRTKVEQGFMFDGKALGIDRQPLMLWCVGQITLYNLLNMKAFILKCNILFYPTTLSRIRYSVEVSFAILLL